MIASRKILFSPIPAIAAAGSGAAGSAAASSAAQTAATAISAGVSGLDFVQNLGFGIANLILQNRAYNEQMQWQRDVYNDQKALNDPSYIMARRRLAGLNPYGDFSGGLSTGQPTPVMPNAVSDAINGLSGSLSRSADKAFQALSTKLAFKSLELQDKKLDNEIYLTEEQAKNLRSTTAYQELINEITEATKGSSIELSKMQVDKLFSDILLNNVNIQWLPEKLKAEIGKLNEDTKSTRYNWTKYMPAMLLLNQSLGDSTISLNEENLKKIAAEVEDISNRGFAMKEIQKDVKNMKPGIAKSFMIAFLGVLENLNKIPLK